MVILKELGKVSTIHDFEIVSAGTFDEYQELCLQRRRHGLRLSDVPANEWTSYDFS